MHSFLSIGLITSKFGHDKASKKHSAQTFLYGLKHVPRAVPINIKFLS